ncbi:tetratricopeptide repeat-containing sulfotransferase family protein [Sessilibacter corallicola]|uniref:Tetratricopeptide repeat protein n=1 Tax=Sessilibacter corallicola TaxID=2904075 RepID=A0ABQ0A3X9_9GAMM
MSIPKANNLFDNPSDQLHAVTQLLADGNIDNAAALCVQLTKSFPRCSDVWRLLSSVSLQLTKPKLAIDSALKAVELNPKSTLNFIQLTKSYLAIHEWKNAKKAIAYAQQLPLNNDADLIADLAKTTFDTGDIDKPLELYNQALIIDNNHIEALHNRALLYRFQGNFDLAEQDYQRLLQIQPNDVESLYELSQLKTWDNDHPGLERINAINKNAQSWKERAYVEFALGKFLEDQKRFEDAFNHYHQGNKIIHHQNAQVNKQFLENDITVHKNLPKLFSLLNAKDTILKDINPKDINAKKSGNDISGGWKPLFILGMPRTGSTLIDRILSNHSSVISGGELTSMPLAIMESVGLSAINDPFLLNLDQLKPPTEKSISFIKNRYRQLTQDKARPDNNHKFVIDKLPFNHKFIGHIISAFPDAKIIYSQRNLSDTLISNYKMLFNHGYSYSYNLESLTVYLRSFAAMMNQWQKLYPQNIHILNYETLIESPESTITNVLSFCGLSIEQRCFEFYKNPTPSHTASASQIRQPMHKKSIHHWKHYESQLTEFTQRFKQ